MKELLRMGLEDGAAIVVEVDESDYEAGVVRVSRSPGDVVIESGKQFTDAVEAIRPVAGALLGAIRGIDVKPDEAEVTFGLKLTVSTGAVIASAAGEGNFQVRLKWASHAEPR